MRQAAVQNRRSGEGMSARRRNSSRGGGCRCSQTSSVLPLSTSLEREHTVGGNHITMQHHAFFFFPPHFCFFIYFFFFSTRQGDTLTGSRAGKGWWLTVCSENLIIPTLPADKHYVNSTPFQHIFYFMHTVYTNVDDVGCLYIQLLKRQSLCSVVVSYVMHVCEDLSCLEVNAGQFLTEANVENWNLWHTYPHNSIAYFCQLFKVWKRIQICAFLSFKWRRSRWQFNVLTNAGELFWRFSKHPNSTQTCDSTGPQLNHCLSLSDRFLSALSFDWAKIVTISFFPICWLIAKCRNDVSLSNSWRFYDFHLETQQYDTVKD